MNKKVLITILIMGALGYLLYWYITKPEEAFDEITYAPQHSDAEELPRVSSFITQDRTEGLNKINVYRIRQKVGPQGLTESQAREIAQILRFDPNRLEFLEYYENLGSYSEHKEDDSYISISTNGRINIGYPLLDKRFSEDLNTFEREAISFLEESGITQLAQLEQGSYRIQVGELEDVEHGHDDHRDEPLIYELIITPLIQGKYEYKTRDVNNLIIGKFPIEFEDDFFQPEIIISINYALVIDILQETDYSVISLREAFEKVNMGEDDRIFVRGEGLGYAFAPNVTTKISRAETAEFLYLIEGDKLLPYYRLSGRSQFNPIDSGLLHFYIPAIKR